MPGFELIGEEERREVLQVLDSGVLMRYGFDAARKGQWKSRELEQALTKRLNTRYTHVCSSGTAALSTALAACGIGAGDEVILPPFTFVAALATPDRGSRPRSAEDDLGTDRTPCPGHLLVIPSGTQSSRNRHQKQRAVDQQQTPA